MIRSSMAATKRRRHKTALRSARRIADHARLQFHKILPVMLADARALQVGVELYWHFPFTHPNGACCGGWENPEKAAAVLAIRVHEQEREIRYLRGALQAARPGSLVRREAFHSRRFG